VSNVEHPQTYALDSAAIKIITLAAEDDKIFYPADGCRHLFLKVRKYPSNYVDSRP
jgi:hypothetical protein